MPIHVTTSTTQSLSNKTFVDRVSTTGVVYADSGNSNQWSSAYSSVYATSASWDSTYTSLNTNSAKYDSVYANVGSNSANWTSTYNTVYTNSGSWDYQGSDIKALTANWQNTYTTVDSNSAEWDSTYTTVSVNSSKYDSAYTSLNSNSAKYDSAYTTVFTESGNWKQELSFDENNARLSISNGNFVSLSALSSSGGGGGITVETDPVFATWAQANSGKYESTYNTFYTNSGSWDYQGSDIKALTANWQNTYTTVSSYSASWGVGGGTDSQSLSFNENNNLLSISNGNIVSLSALSNTEVIIRTESFSTSSNVLTNVSPLSTTVEPYEKVLIEIMGAKRTQLATEGMTVGFTGPNGAQVRFHLDAWISTTGSRVTSQGTTFPGSVTDGTGNTAVFPFCVICIAVMGANGGPIQFQVASELASPTGPLVISDLMVMRVHRIP